MTSICGKGRFGVFTVNFEQISHIILVFPLFTKLVNAGWQALPIWNKDFNPLSANPQKWSNTLKQFVGNTRRIFECVWPFCEVGD